MIWCTSFMIVAWINKKIFFTHNIFNCQTPRLRPSTLLKRDFNTGVFLLNVCKIFKNTNFEEHLLTAASESRFSSTLQYSKSGGEKEIIYCPYLSAWIFNAAKPNTTLSILISKHWLLLWLTNNQERKS